jgi:hypothetical protein
LRVCSFSFSAPLHADHSPNLSVFLQLRNDSNKLEVAFFDHGHDSLFSKSHDRLPVLRIQSGGMRILDEIIATFVYFVKYNSDSSTTSAVVIGAAVGAS